MKSLLLPINASVFVSDTSHTAFWASKHSSAPVDALDTEARLVQTFVAPPDAATVWVSNRDAAFGALNGITQMSDTLVNQSLVDFWDLISIEVLVPLPPPWGDNACSRLKK